VTFLAHPEHKVVIGIPQSLCVGICQHFHILNILSETAHRHIDKSSNDFSFLTTSLIVGLQWTVPQLSIMIIYNSTWSILIQWTRDILPGDKLTKESVLPVCDQPYHMNNEFQEMWTEIKKLWNHALAQKWLI